MFPDRLWLALGSGQRLNEDITGAPWPDKAERNARLAECAEIIRALLDGETVTHRGRVTVIDAKLYSRPARRPLLLGAAVTEATAELVGGWADGLLTVSAEPAAVKRLVDAFRRGGGEGRPMVMQVGLNWAPTDAEAEAGAHAQWHTNVLGGDVNWELRSPEDFETATRHVRPEDMSSSLLISSDLKRHAAWLAEFLDLGFDQLLLHQVDRCQRRFIEAFGSRVLPELK
jgi:G6PDH family F420-dependent oxidoreductase